MSETKKKITKAELKHFGLIIAMAIFVLPGVFLVLNMAPTLIQSKQNLLNTLRHHKAPDEESKMHVTKVPEEKAGLCILSCEAEKNLQK